MTRLCEQCEEKPAVAGSLPWYAEALMFLMGGIDTSGRYCADCAGGRNFIALLVVCAVLLISFVVLVIFW
jgi:hypothetical protein